MREKVRDKVRRLLALAEGNPNPHEAAAAAAMAQALMSRHAIDEAMLDVGDPEKPIHVELGEKTKTMVAWRGQLSVAVAKANRCETYWGATPDGRRQLRVVGTRDDVAAVRYLHPALVRMCRASAKAAQQAGIIRGRAESNAYRLGWVAAVGRRLMQTAQQAKQSAPGAALVRLDQRALRAKQSAQKLPLRKPRKVKYSGREAFAKGQADGRRARLDAHADLVKGDAGQLH